MFPSHKGIGDNDGVDCSPEAVESVKAVASILRSCRTLRHLQVHRDKSPFVPTDIPWQVDFIDAFRAGRGSQLEHLELSIGTRPNTESETAELLRLVGPKLKQLIGIDLWMDQQGLAAISTAMPKLKHLCMDSAVLTLDMPDYPGRGSLLADVLAATRYHTRRAQLPKERLVEFISRWGAEFWYNDCRLIDWAVTAENIPFVETLLEYGASPNMAYPWSVSSPLMDAIRIRNVKIARLLLRYGASPDESPECVGHRPLHESIMCIDHAMISLLFEYGVYPHAINDAGLTAMSLAAGKGFSL